MPFEIVDVLLRREKSVLNLWEEEEEEEKSVWRSVLIHGKRGKEKSVSTMGRGKGGGRGEVCVLLREEMSVSS